MAGIFSLEAKGLKLDSAADAEPHAEALRAAGDVVEVRLHGNTFGVGACRALAEVLATKKTLETANLADIFTGRLLHEIPEALGALLTALLNLPRLHTVNLNDNAFGLNTQAPLVDFLGAHAPLRHLYLNNNGLGPHAGILIADALARLHAAKRAARDAGADVPDLETVVCGRNRLENGSMTAWAAAFRLHNSVRTVRMVQNGIRQEGIGHLLADGLAGCKDLRVLDLQDNTFTLHGARALADAVLGWAGLVELGVGDSLVGNKGGLLVAAALARGANARLEVLRLQYNELRAATVKALVDAAAALPALRRVELNGNKLSEDDAAVAALRDLLEERRDGDDSDWGLDSLSDLEDESDDESEADEPTVDERAEKLIKEAEEAQEEPTVQLKDSKVDELADELGKASI